MKVSIKPRLFMLDGSWRCWTIAPRRSYGPVYGGSGRTPAEAYDAWLTDSKEQARRCIGFFSGPIRDAIGSVSVPENAGLDRPRHYI